MEYQKHPINLDSALEIFSKAIESADLTTHMKIKMSQRRLEFLEDFGSSIVQLKECYEDHQKLIKDLQAADKKRKAPEAGANGDDTSTTTTTSNTSAVSSSTAIIAAQVSVPPPEKKDEDKRGNPTAHTSNAPRTRECTTTVVWEVTASTTSPETHCRLVIVLVDF
ncbi:pre-mRNA-processing factor 39-like isoform X2 [Mya arenaria]|uniref:pre-mRNA-processing factor 39-like isoform X2 n=1 Tax=Mya arenaria TaxID=6604 RepID=UPI0022E4C195|nr:pre-mRNA-processing factor 39-like isoform X2 [Mya arenaria]